MGKRSFSILCLILVTVSLTAGTALTNEATLVVPSSNSRSVLAPPTLTVTTAGTTVSLSWTSVAGAAAYTLYYAPYPYTGPDSIGSIPVGTQTSMSAGLWAGASFYVAVEAYNSVESSGYSNIDHFTINSLPTYTNSLGQVFVLLPPGTFIMGSPLDEPGRDKDETQHQVTLTQSFYMQTTEVTQAQWEAVMGSNPSYFSGCASCPVENISWNDVQNYIAQINLRGEGTYGLPTEAQWEYAVRAGTTTAFPNGEITETECKADPHLVAIGWYCYNSEYITNPVGLKSPNAWGLYDISGNVWEWCQDWYAGYPSGPVIDPAGPSSGAARVARGGHWLSYARNCRSAYRTGSEPSIHHSYFGVRLLKQP